jgi:hypothetical protein
MQRQTPSPLLVLGLRILSEKRSRKRFLPIVGCIRHHFCVNEFFDWYLVKFDRRMMVK